MIIRWLGAFGYANDLQGSLAYELSSCPKTGKVRCAEKLRSGKTNIPNHVRVGLLVKNTAVVRKYSSDVFSIYHGEGERWLKATRKENRYSKFGHTECWVRPKYIGIVLRSGGRPIPRQALRILRDKSIEFGVPIFKLFKDGELREVVITNG